MTKWPWGSRVSGVRQKEAGWWRATRRRGLRRSWKGLSQHSREKDERAVKSAKMAIRETGKGTEAGQKVGEEYDP